jgi:unsaturated chondroitin disaccharide hydrolase
METKILILQNITMMKNIIKLSFLIPVIVGLSGCGTTHLVASTVNELSGRVPVVFERADSQYRYMIKNLPPETFPKTFEPTTGKFQTSGSDWWCSGFYPGTLLNIFQETKDTALLTEAQRMLNVLEKEKNNKSTHDLGFMMYCSFGTANQVAPDPRYNEILLTSARSLASRFNPKVGCIKSWDSKPSDFLVIIDNMMNLELLFWATKYSGDSSFYKIAVAHANTTMKNHFRSDYSSYHVVNYDPATGEVQKKRTAQGYSDESAWARGQAWGLYGYTVMYRETKDPKYLEQAKHIASFILDHPNLPKDKIPYWDFNAPGIPNILRDASAGAIMASALLELSSYATGSESRSYLTSAETMLNSLSAPPYLAAAGTNGGFLLQHCVGNMPNKTEIDVPLTYADYYYIEALKRYKNLNAGKSINTASGIKNKNSFRPGDVWTDNNGTPINAHGGGVLYSSNKYYWFGEKRGRVASEGVSVYSSDDLYNWKNEGIALALEGDTSSEISRGCIIERPKVIYNEKTHKYVMWFHLELKRQGYRAARAAVAVSDKVSGPYKYLGSFRPNGNMSRDMNLFVDDDGSAYQIYSSRDNYDLRVVKLTDDYLHATTSDSMLFSLHREAPSIFKYKGQYFLFTSGCTGWTPNMASVHTSTSIWGPWKQFSGTPLEGPNADSTYGGQSTYILPVQGKEGAFIFMADRWNPRNLTDSRYLWLPIQFNNGMLYINWMTEWKLKFFDKNQS